MHVNDFSLYNIRYVYIYTFKDVHLANSSIYGINVDEFNMTIIMKVCLFTS